MSNNQLDYLLSPKAVRERSQKLFEHTQAGLGHWNYHPEKWDELVLFVDQVISENYPEGNIPFHSRLGHFRPGGIDRLEAWLKPAWQNLSREEQAMKLIDLVVPSVLLDAGAGNTWTWKEEKTGFEIGRSEGLGLASLKLFCDGHLSHRQQMETTVQGLRSLEQKTLEEVFQVGPKNPLVGVEGRLSLLKKLADTLKERPGEMLSSFINSEGKICALLVLKTLLKTLGPIWPSRFDYEGVALGDTWSHKALGEMGAFESFVPFHKLSQWMSYSLLDAMKWAGFELTNVDQLTGLPEYRNGGLLIDMGLLSAKDPTILTRGISAEEEATIEWRALTIILLDELGDRIQKKRGLSSQDFPLAKVLEGGSWWAGRKIAKQKRSDSSPPLNIISDGTVF